MKFNINHADIKEWAKNYDGPLFEGILCDPPYELGFMGKSWDSSGIAFDKDMWADILKLLKPGGHLLAFSGSRTYHRMAVAIEDAGFEIRDMIEWVYGSGFPKSLNIGKAVDKIQGNEREDSHEVKFSDGAGMGLLDKSSTVGKSYTETKGTSPYEGYGTALKPAHEPCVLARKPLEKGMTVAGNALKHGTGGLNIDESRVGTRTENESGWSKTGSKASDNRAMSGANYDREPKDEVGLGRFPANLIHDGSNEVEAVFPQTKSGAMNSIAKPNQYNTYGKMYERQVTNPASSGSASRFFYTAKASKSERNAGLEAFEEKDLNDSKNKGNLIGSEWVIDPRHKDGGYLSAVRKPTANMHPTVKPLSLTKYLATLIKPPTGGRLLVPFSGSGSEMIGALQAGWEYVEGVELTDEYIPIAEARIKYWLEQEDKQVRLI